MSSDSMTHKVEFVDSENSLNPDTPYIGYTFNVIFTDTLLMFHICHLYHNCLQLVDAGEMKESEIDDYITLKYVILSVQEALDNRIKCLSASYIDDNYKWCYEKPKIFDKCLEYFSKIKKELTKLYEDTQENQKSKVNKNDNTSETFN